jgi:hypothetical protein
MGFPNSDDAFPNLASAIRLPEKRVATPPGERRRRRVPSTES